GWMWTWHRPSQQGYRKHDRAGGEEEGKPHSLMRTGVPFRAWAKTRRSISFGIRMQPFETALPIDQGALVPWMAIGPPCVQPVKTSEKAEIPTAPGPKGPLRSTGMSRWLT